MPFKSDCPNCGVTYDVAEEKVGLTEVCEKCGSSFQLIPESQVVETAGDLNPPSRSVPERDENLPCAIGRYQVLKSLGRGGMGEVYLAVDSGLNRQVALKVPLRDHARFLREARVAAQFQHTNFCPIYDIGEDNGVPFLVMAFIEGETLADQIIRDLPWEPHQAVELIQTLAGALAEAHRKGVIHRDLKPSNIMIDSLGRLFLMDFGLARQVDTSGPMSTADGTILGTATYMPPEQAKGHVKEVGPHSDLYSLGIILYELLAGRPPFEGEFVWEVLYQVVNASPSDLASLNHDIDPDLEAIVVKAIAKRPEDRFASMDAFAMALRGWLDRSLAPDPTKKAVEPAPNLHYTIAQFAGTWTNSLGMKLALIPAGDFLMGSDHSDNLAADNEMPRHRVRITRSFYLGVYPVTQAEYRAVTGNDPCSFPGFDDRPVETVSWLDAVAFCNNLSELDGLSPCYRPTGETIPEGTGYYLPTEAEWEYACRAGSNTRFYFGDDLALLCDHACFGENADGGTNPVGLKAFNAFGLYDMYGNVWEWCSDRFDADYYRESPFDDPPGPRKPAGRVIRGGSWRVSSRLCRSANRGSHSAASRYNFIGFRVARVQSSR